MKLHVVFGSSGEIIAAAQLDSGAPVRVRPVHDEAAGHRAAEMFVPSEYRHYDLAAICQRLKVHARGKLHELMPRD